MLVVTWGLLKEFVGMQESKDVLNYEKMHSIDKRRAAIDRRYEERYEVKEVPIADLKKRIK